tara:strand:+ start:7974 stop:8246 length:273 start_codon:yes stop_codon:yes gene_type:complete
MTKKQLITDMEKLDQQLLFDSAFEYLNTKYGKVNLATCIQGLESDETPQEKKFSIGWAALSLLSEQSREFDNIKHGLSNNMRKNIVGKMC